MEQIFKDKYNEPEKEYVNNLRDISERINA